MSLKKIRLRRNLSRLVSKNFNFVLSNADSLNHNSLLPAVLLLCAQPGERGLYSDMQSHLAQPGDGDGATSKHSECGMGLALGKLKW